MRILIATFGSLGDLFPYLNIANRLAGNGHFVTLATNESYRERVEAAGLGFRALRPHIAASSDFFKKTMGEFNGGRYLLRKLMFPAIRDSYEDLKNALPSHDVLVTQCLIFAGALLARETGIPWVSTALVPLNFFSRKDPPVLLAALRGLRHRSPGLLNLINKSAQRSTNGWSRPVDRLRKELGQPSTGNPLFEGQHSPRSVLALFSKHFAVPQDDWPPQSTLTGFPLSPPATLPPDIERFLAAGPPPVVFTLGSSAVFTPGKFFDVARSLGVRAILLTGPDAPAFPPTPDLLAVSYAPHSAVFPHAAAVVHQAGIGTTSEVLRSGRPSIVVPFAFDQPDNGSRLERLGVARVLNRRSVNAKQMKRELEMLLGSASYAAAAKTIAQQIQGEDGAGAAAHAITGGLKGE